LLVPLRLGYDVRIKRAASGAVLRSSKCILPTRYAFHLTDSFTTQSDELVGVYGFVFFRDMLPVTVIIDE
jgi:hypothetical protein